jgi:putative transposase
MAHRVQNNLINNDENVSCQRAARLMGSVSVESKMANRFVITANSKNTTSLAPCLLKQNFSTTSINQVWVSDNAVIWTRQGWLYLAIMLDLYSH